MKWRSDSLRPMKPDYSRKKNPMDIATVSRNEPFERDNINI